MFRTLVGIQSDTDKITGGINKIGGREQTVLRSGVAWSEDARHTVALRCRRDKHDRPPAAFRFGLSGFPGRVPGNTRLTQIELRSPKIARSRPLPARDSARKEQTRHSQHRNNAFHKTAVLLVVEFKFQLSHQSIDQSIV